MNHATRLFILCALLAGAADADSRPAAMGPVSFASDGAGSVAPAMLRALSSGGLSPVLQFVFYSHFLNSCAAELRRRAPARSTSYREAKKAFDDVACRMQSCLNQAMLLSLLPTLAKDSRSGEDSAAFLASLLQSFRSQDGGCFAVDPQVAKTVQESR